MNTNTIPLISQQDATDLRRLLSAKINNQDAFTRLTPRDIAVMKRNLTARVPREMISRKDHLDDPDSGFPLAERLKLIAEIHKAILQNPPRSSLALTSADQRELDLGGCWAALLVWPRPRLEAFHFTVCHGDPASRIAQFGPFIRAVRELPDAIYLFTQNPTTSAERDVARNESQKRKALARDNYVCVLTGTPIVEACHIIPFHAKRRPMETYKLVDRLEAYLGPDAYSKLLEKVDLGNTTNIIDTAANMITLSRPFHRLWEEGRFAFEPIEYMERKNPNLPKEEPVAENSAAQSTKEQALANQPSAPASTSSDSPRTHSKRLRDLADAKEKAEREAQRRKTEAEAKAKEKQGMQIGIKLIFHWLDKTGLGGFSDRVSRLDADPRELFEPQENLDNEFHALNAVPTDTGHVVTIWANDIRNLPDWDFLQLQWAILRIHRLTGAADPNLYIPQKDQDDDEKLAALARAAKQQSDFKIAARQAQDPALRLSYENRVLQLATTLPIRPKEPGPRPGRRSSIRDRVRSGSHRVTNLFRRGDKRGDSGTTSTTAQSPDILGTGTEPSTQVVSPPQQSSSQMHSSHFGGQTLGYSSPDVPGVSPGQHGQYSGFGPGTGQLSGSLLDQAEDSIIGEKENRGRNYGQLGRDRSSPSNMPRRDTSGTSSPRPKSTSSSLASTKRRALAEITEQISQGSVQGGGSVHSRRSSQRLSTGHAGVDSLQAQFDDLEIDDQVARRNSRGISSLRSGISNESH